MSSASASARRWKRFWPIPFAGVPGGHPRGGRTRVPTVLQMEAVECGAAALAMILAWFGRVVPLEELRAACGVSRDGSKASNMVRAARSYGLKAQGFKREPAKLREIAGPMILHWNFNHFVVLEGIHRGRVYLNDPAVGARVVTEAELDEAFTGVVLVFERGPDFRKGRGVEGMAVALKRRLAGTHWALTFVVLAGLALAIVGLVTPSLTRIFVDEVLIRGVMDWLGPLLLAMAAIAVVIAALTWLQQRFLLLLETKIAVGGTGRVLWHTLHLSAEFFAQRFAGEIASRVAINDRVARLLSGELATTVLSLFMVCLYAILMSQYDGLLTGVCVATAALNVIGLRYVSRRRVDVSQRLLLDHGRAMGAAMNGLQTIETLKASGAESDFFARWAGRYAKVVNAEQQLGIQTQVLVVLPPLLLGVSTACFLALGGLRVIDGHLSMGMLIAFQALMLAFLAPVNLLVQIGGTMQEVKGDLTRLDDVLRAPAQWVSDVPPPATASPKLAGALELVNVTFGYSRLDAPLIENFSLTLHPGSRVALVGGSGCGKSTVARLVAGLYAPWSGEVRFDGQPRAAIAPAILTNSLAVVDQDIVLFEGSITDNVTTWDSTLTEQHIVAAARDACIDDDIMARIGGYATIVEEGGRNFSGGQRQRLEIARALAGNPTILVLDEATSALDPTTERLIDDNVRRRGCTCLIVAHRLSTIRDCDEIVVLDRGQIVQRGTHDVLKTAPGLYARLIAAE